MLPDMPRCVSLQSLSRSRHDLDFRTWDRVAALLRLSLRCRPHVSAAPQVAVESSQVSNLPSAVPDILLRLVFPVPSLLVVVAVAVVAAVVVAGSWYCCGAGKAGA